ncbi:NADH-quinone oxidoreductase subunit NuoK [Stieleria sp. ICT_E10.1]|uniref:NADH-quinone oxidoreductase subunit NuoK n=1 Tax=Stieleria sedimenti TaxID=2976331 RepID=UPI0021802840|nr:NADH-quinone oxidoreductase subunit NuoK [Stieleria sedimenti]MCS7470128.1 NADH-quinone oxidoreductase subunit NuoK [Stieleria sedimenti]
MFPTPTITHWLTLSALLFSIGLYGIFTRRNAVGVLLSIEMTLNSAILNILIFNRFVASDDVDGQVLVLFIVAAAAAEAVVALAIFVSFYRHRHTLDVTQANHICDQGNSAS